MIRRNNKTRKYQAPYAHTAYMVLERNFCMTVRFNVKVQELENINMKTGDEAEPMYFEF